MSRDWTEFAEIAVRKMAQAKPGENLLVLTDTWADPAVPQACLEAGIAAGIDTTMLVIPGMDPTDTSELDDVTIAAIAAADVVLGVCETMFTAKESTDRALDDRVDEVFAQKTYLGLGRVHVSVHIVERGMNPGNSNRKSPLRQEAVVGLLDRVGKAARLDPSAVHGQGHISTVRPVERWRTDQSVDGKCRRFVRLQQQHLIGNFLTVNTGHRIENAAGTDCAKALTPIGGKAERYMWADQRQRCQHPLDARKLTTA